MDDDTTNSQTSENVTEVDDIIDISEEKANETIEIEDGETSQEDVILDEEDRSEGDGAESDQPVEKQDETGELHNVIIAAED